MRDRSIIDTIQEIDGFEYVERSAKNKESGDGARFRYICRDSQQGRARKTSSKKDVSQQSEDSDDEAKKRSLSLTFDCGGAVHVNFSLKREAIHVVFKHNPIHNRPKNDDRYVLSIELYSICCHVFGPCS